MEPVLTRNKQPAPGHRPRARQRAGQAALPSSSCLQRGRACASTAGEALSYKPSCSEDAVGISQQSSAAGSECWTSTSAQTPLRHHGGAIRGFSSCLDSCPQLQSCCIFTSIFSLWRITSFKFAPFQS